MNKWTRQGFFALFGLWGVTVVSAQNVGINWHPPDGFAYQSEALPEIHVTCDQLDWMLQQENWYSNVEHPATFVFISPTGSDTISNVGFRLRGNTSREAPKKSYKISFNTFDSSQSWEGLQKMNLNSEHNDPSAMRARLSWECLRDAGVPVSRSTHLKLFINGNYYGLYSNTEHIDGEWLEKRFEHAHGNLWKCTYPANLDFVSNNPNDYKFTPSWSEQRIYELKTNKAIDDYTSLAEFIDVLNNSNLDEMPCALEAIFDVDAYLKAAAGEILFGHWDNYIGNKNNFYLYERTTDGRLMYIPYDMDNTAGIQWFGEWSDQDIYSWTAENDRVLYTRLLEVETYRNRFTWYIQWWMDSFYTTNWVEARGMWLIDLMSDAIEQDIYYPESYGFNPTDFVNSITEAWGNHVAHSPLDYASSRIFWADIQSDPLPTNISPILQCWAEGPVLNDSLHIQCWAPELTESTDWFVEAEVERDGNLETFVLDPAGGSLHGYGWSKTVPLNGSEDVFWRAFATDPQGAIQHSPCTLTRIWNTFADSPILINEVMPINTGFTSDENGNDGDWVELINTGAVPYNCDGLFLSNRHMEPWRFPLPSVTLNPEQHLLVWCDDNPQAGSLHANFTLAGGGDEVYLFTLDDERWRAIDVINWTEAIGNFSLGRVTDGAQEWVWFNPNSSSPPTPNGANGTTMIVNDEGDHSVLIPAVCDQPCWISLLPPTQLTLRDISGNVVGEFPSASILLNGYPTGLYFLTNEINSESTTHKIILR